MTTENILSIWTGNFESQKEFDNYIEEVFNEEEESSSKFMTDFEIDYLDNQFQECVFFNENIVLEMLNDASYSKSFLNKLSEIDFREDNSIVILYNFKYENSKEIDSKLNFLGSFSYVED